MRNRSLLLAVLSTVAAAGLASCEHRKKETPAAPPPEAPAAQTPPAGKELPPEPVAKEPAPAAGSADEVRPPTAADLAEYTKDLPGDGPLTATIETNMGVFHCELYADKAPMTVANFVGLATGKKPWRNPRTGEVMKGKPFYDGLSVHRVAPGFVIQGGDPLGNGSGGPGYEFAQEVSPDLKHEAGVLSMANAGPGTNGSQFFITETATPMLDGGYNVFGKCKEADLVKKMTALGRGDGPPSKPITFTKITIGRGEKK
jgi:peptidyl-prolyl cis-trans isomerase A (cyclophilin A)